MSNDKPVAEVAISHDLIHALLSEFVPELANEPLELIGAGWDNEIHRVGPDHAVRLPRREAANQLTINEHRWLSELEEQLPVAIPTPTYAGKPAFGFPWHWSVVPWLPGVAVAHAPVPMLDTFAQELADFLNALHVAAPDDAPRNPYRGVPLADRTASLHESAAQLDGDLGAQVIDLWAELVDTPEWGGDPLWVHGDLHPLNMLLRSGHLHAVIDFGDLTAGDPATDIAVAWMLFDKSGREELRKQLTINAKSVEIHTWNRARAWALSLSVTYIANSARYPTLRRIGDETLARVLDE